MLDLPLSPIDFRSLDYHRVVLEISARWLLHAFLLLNLFFTFLFRNSLKYLEYYFYICGYIWKTFIVFSLLLLWNIQNNGWKKCGLSVFKCIQMYSFLKFLQDGFYMLSYYSIYTLHFYSEIFGNIWNITFIYVDIFGKPLLCFSLLLLLIYRIMAGRNVV